MGREPREQLLVVGQHFSEHLLGDNSQPVNMVEMDREMEQSGTKKKP